MNKYLKYTLDIDDTLNDSERNILVKAAKIVLGSKGVPIAKPVALQPIMERVKQPLSNAYLFNSQEIKLENTYFPKAVKSIDVSKYWQEHKAKCADSSMLLHYGSSVAYHQDFQDVSLYEASRLIAAVSKCLERSENIVLLGGCINGIQTYLYDLVSKNASKLLKGRSFYVQLLVDSVLLELYKELDLDESHKVYASGGAFFLLAPAESVGKFETACKKIANDIYKEHKTALYVSFKASKAFDENVKIQAVWSSLMDDLELQKYRRLSDKLLTNYTDFFDAQETGGIQMRDVITNDEFDEAEQEEFLEKRKKNHWDKVQYLDYDEQEKPKTNDIGDYQAIKSLTHKQIKLGDNLAVAKAFSNIKNDNNIFELNPCDLGNFYLYSSENDENLTYFNKTNKENFAFYGGNKVPLFKKGEEYEKGKTVTRHNHRKSFNELAADDALTRLAVLRMDVDNLGAHFKENISDVNLARYATLSSHLDYFFKGYLNVLQAKYPDTVAIIYSGGDDLFVVGKWNHIIDLTLEIQDAFKAWACQNPNLSISGGIAIVDEKFPIMQAARMAGDAEKQAKKHNINGIAKNAITLFGVPLRWDSEMEVVRDLRNVLTDMFIFDNSYSKSLLSKINQHAIMQEKQLKNNETQSWRWLVAYDLARYRERGNFSKEQKKLIESIAVSSFTDTYKNKKIISNYPFLKLMQIAARWVQMELR